MAVHSVIHETEKDEGSASSNNGALNQQNSSKYLGPQALVFNSFALLMLCVATVAETISKCNYILHSEGQLCHNHITILLIKFGFEVFFIIFFALIGIIDSFFSSIENENNLRNDFSVSKFLTIPAIVNLSIILLLGLASDAMPFGNEGNPFLTWNKFGQMASNDKLAYILVNSLDQNNCNYDGASIFYNIVVNLNRDVNLTEIDHFLTDHNCRLNDDLSSFLHSIHSGCTSPIYC